jgi:hypothetical protein
MSLFRSLVRRILPAKTNCRRQPMIEGLESRQMFSSGPVLTGIHLTGSVRDVTSVVLTFDESLDLTTAEDLQAYHVGKLVPAGSDNGGSFDWTQLLGLLAQPKAKLLVNGRVQFTAATYDDSTDSVTLTPVRDWNALAYFRFVRIIGAGTYAITDVAGNPLNDGLNTYVHWFPHLGKSFTYRDSDGDLVNLTLHGPGQIVAFLQTNADHAPMVFILNGRSNSVLSGSVRQSKTGDGVAVIPELQGVATIQATILTNPQFEVLTTEP